MVIRKKRSTAVEEARANGEPTKQQVDVVPAPTAAPTPTTVPARVIVVNEKPGTVTFFDKIKNYYKGLIITLGSLLIVLNQFTPIFNFVGDGTAKQYFTAAVAVVTTVLAILKENEKWVDRLPSENH